MGRQPLEKPGGPGPNGRDVDTGSTLLPMLVAGLLLVAVGGLAIMVFV